MSTEQDERFAAAQQWYAKLPRNEFEHVLTVGERERVRAEKRHAGTIAQLESIVQAQHRILTNYEARLNKGEAAVQLARETFRRYGDLHAAKPDLAKADANYKLAQRMELALNEMQFALGDLSESLKLVAEEAPNEK